VPSTTKRSAKILCRGGSVWIPPRQFWDLVRENLVEYLSEPPLTGRFRGRPADFLVTINHTILNMACPEHRTAVLVSKRFMKKRKSVSV
jgi:hypothetical protein